MLATLLAGGSDGVVQRARVGGDHQAGQVGQDRGGQGGQLQGKARWPRSWSARLLTVLRNTVTVTSSYSSSSNTVSSSAASAFSIKARYHLIG